METVNVTGLKNSPSDTLCLAHRDLVVVMNRNSQDAVLIGIESQGVLDAKGVRPFLATALFREGNLSLTRAANLAGLRVSEFASHVYRLGIPVVRLDSAEAARPCKGACG